MKEDHIIEFDKIKELWKQYALSDYARTQIDTIEPIYSENELKLRQKETGECRQLMEKLGNPPLVSMSGMEEVLMIAQKDDCLSPMLLDITRQALVAVGRMKQYLERGKCYDNTVAYYAENLEELEELQAEIGQAVNQEDILDHASDYLFDIRREIARNEEKMREKAETVIRNNKDCMSDSFCTFRNGHLCVPVKKDCKFRINGSVIDKSQTGSTLFIEPTSVFKYYEELQGLHLEEENEIRRILYTLTVQVEKEADTILQNVRTMENLDFMFSKAKLSLSMQATEPEILANERKIKLTEARHPLLPREVCVPLDFEIGGATKGIVITGPNTGGKTVAIKTVALCAKMAQCGLHVPCAKAQIAMFRNILCDIGDGQNISENLSTFSAHITNVMDVLSRITPDSLVIMDELGSGTDPQEGMGIAVAILKELMQSGALFLVTTHYPEVKTFAAREEGIVNARMTFDAENLKPLYQMVIGEAGESCALYIAKRLGMPENMLKNALQAAYPADWEKHGKDILTGASNLLEKKTAPKLQKKKQVQTKKECSLKRGDSVMVYPDHKIGIVCKTADEKGIVQVQLQKKVIYINHKRVKLLVAAEELYPEDYDFSIVFDSVQTRKLRHQMERKYVENAELVLEEGKKPEQ